MNRVRDEKIVMRNIYIKKMHIAGASLGQLSKEFGLSRTRIEHILYGKRFRSRKSNGNTWEYLKQRAYEQFNFKCFLCKNFHEDDMDVVPIDGNRRSQRLENLVPFCRDCYRDWYYKNNNNSQ